MDRGRSRVKRKTNEEPEKNNLKKTKYKQSDPPGSDSSSNSAEVNNLMDLIDNINNNNNVDVNLYKLIDLVVNNTNINNLLEVLRTKLLNLNNILVYKILDILSFLLDSTYVNSKDKGVNRELRNKNVLRLIEVLESVNLIKNKEIISVIDSNKLDSCNYSEGLIKIFIREKTKNNYVLKLFNLYRENVLGYNSLYHYLSNYVTSNTSGSNSDRNSSSTDKTSTTGSSNKEDNTNNRDVYKTLSSISGYYKLCPNKILYDLLCVIASSNMDCGSEEVFNLFKCYGKYNVLHAIKLYLKNNYNESLVDGNDTTASNTGNNTKETKGDEKENKDKDTTKTTSTTGTSNNTKNRNNCNLENVYNLVGSLVEKDYVDVRGIYSYLDPEDRLLSELSCHYFKLLSSNTSYSATGSTSTVNNTNLVVMNKLVYSDVHRVFGTTNTKDGNSNNSSNNTVTDSNTKDTSKDNSNNNGYLVENSRYNNVLNEMYNNTGSNNSNNNLKVNCKTILENVVKKYKNNDYRILLNIENYSNYKNNLFSLENGKLLILSNILKKCNDFNGENWNKCYSMILHFYKLNYFIYMNNNLVYSLKNIMVSVLKQSFFYNLFYNRNVNVIKDMLNEFVNNSNNTSTNTGDSNSSSTNKTSTTTQNNSNENDVNKLKKELMVLNRLELYFLLVGFRCCVDLKLFNNILNYLYVVLLYVNNLENSRSESLTMNSSNNETMVASNNTNEKKQKRKKETKKEKEKDKEDRKETNTKDESKGDNKDERDKEKMMEKYKNKIKGKVMKLLYKYVLFNVMCCGEGNFQLSDKVWSILELFTTLQRYRVYQKLMDKLLSKEVFSAPFVYDENKKEDKDSKTNTSDTTNTGDSNSSSTGKTSTTTQNSTNRDDKRKMWKDYYESSVPYVKHVYSYYNYKLKNIFKKITYELLKQNKSPLIRSIVSIITSISSVNPMNVCSLIIKQSELFNNLLLPLCELTKYFTRYTIDFFVYLIYSNLVNLINDSKTNASSSNRSREESGLRDSTINVINVNSVMLCKIYKRHYECDIMPVVVVIVLLVNRLNNPSSTDKTNTSSSFGYGSFDSYGSNNNESELVIYNVNDVNNRKVIKNRVGVGGYNSLVVLIGGVLEYLLKLYEMINSVYELDLDKVNLKNILFYVPSPFYQNTTSNSDSNPSSTGKTSTTSRGDKRKREPKEEKEQDKENDKEKEDNDKRDNSNLLQLLYNAINNTTNNNLNKLVTSVISIDGDGDRLDEVIYNPFYECTMMTLLNNVKYDLMYDSQFVDVKMLFGIVDKYNNVIKLTRRQVVGYSNTKDTSNSDSDSSSTGKASTTNQNSGKGDKILNGEFVEYVNSLSVSDIFTPVEQYNNVINRLYSIIYSVVSLTSSSKMEVNKDLNMVVSYVDSLFSGTNAINTSSNSNNASNLLVKNTDNNTTNINPSASDELVDKGNTSVESLNAVDTAVGIDGLGTGAGTSVSSSTARADTGYPVTTSNNAVGKKLRKLYNKIVLLKSNMNNQLEQNKKVLEKLKGMKLVDDESNIGQVTTVNFIKHIIYPRVFMGEMEALFCCKLVDLLVEIRLEYFNYFDFVNCFTKMLIPLIKYSTENELNYFILFFNYVFSTIKEWVGNQNVFDNIVDDNPCFCVTFKYQANKQFKYEQLLKIIKKWEYNILLVIFSVYKAPSKTKTNANVEKKDKEDKDSKTNTDNTSNGDGNSSSTNKTSTTSRGDKRKREAKEEKNEAGKGDEKDDKKDKDENVNTLEEQNVVEEEERKENVNYIEIKNVIIFLNKIVNNFPITFNSSSKILNFLINILKISKSNKWNDINLSTNTLIKMIQMYQNQNKFITIP